MIRGIIFLSFSFLALGSCMVAPEDADLVKHMAVQTTYDTTRIKESSNIFNTYSTFYLQLDTMGYIYNDPNADTILVDPIRNGTYEFVSPVVDAVKNNVVAAGYTRVEADENPDFAVKVVVLENFSYYQTISNGYWGGYYGYGYYYPVVSTYYSNSATLLIEIVDVKNYTENGSKYVVLWRDYIGDLLKTLDLTGRSVEAVDRAFEQSPYISKD